VDPAAAPQRPWYRKPVLLMLWALVVLILIGGIVFGVFQLLEDNGTSAPAPAPSGTSTTTTTTTPTTTATTTPTTTETTTPPSTTNGSPEPAPNPTRQPTQEPTHTHHLPQLPSTITLPRGGPTITLPPH
jgi:cytoskeletal protein RodZ